MDTLHDGRRLPMDDRQEETPEMTMVEKSYLEWAGKEIKALKKERDALNKQLQQAEIAVRLLLDHVDYTAEHPPCRMNEMVGATLPVEIITIARKALTGGGE